MIRPSRRHLAVKGRARRVVVEHATIPVRDVPRNPMGARVEMIRHNKGPICQEVESLLRQCPIVFPKILT